MPGLQLPLLRRYLIVRVWLIVPLCWLLSWASLFTRGILLYVNRVLLWRILCSPIRREPFLEVSPRALKALLWCRFKIIRVLVDLPLHDVNDSLILYRLHIIIIKRNPLTWLRGAVPALAAIILARPRWLYHHLARGAQRDRLWHLWVLFRGAGTDLTQITVLLPRELVWYPRCHLFHANRIFIRSRLFFSLFEKIIC